MAPHDAILGNLKLQPKTKSYGNQLIRQVTSKTAPGSGYTLSKQGLDVAIPAVCMRIASEKLNNGDVSEATAQGLSCLTRAKYKKAYSIISAIVEEIEQAELTYEELHTIYRTDSLHAAMKPFLTQVEKELLRLDKGLERKMEIFTAAVFFWVCGSAQVKNLPETMVFAAEHGLPGKRFVQLLTLLNENCEPLKKKIQNHFKGKMSSPTKKSTTSTPQQSPLKIPLPGTTIDEQETPSKRQTRQSSSQLANIPMPSPTKRVTQPSTTNIVQPSPLRRVPGKKAPIRELPSKDSPKKRSVPNEQDRDDGMDIDSPAIVESPSKKRKVESPSKAIVESSPAPTSSNTRKAAVGPEVFATPVKKKLVSTTVSPAALRSKSHKQMVVVESDSSSDESEPEMNLSMRRFRPVYLGFKQWNTRDPRLDRIWKKAGKQCRALAASGLPGESDRMDIDS